MRSAAATWGRWRRISKDHPHKGMALLRRPTAGSLAGKAGWQGRRAGQTGSLACCDGGTLALASHAGEENGKSLSPVAAVGGVVFVVVSSKRDAETPLALRALLSRAGQERAPDLQPLALPLPFWLSLARVMPAHITAMSPTDHAHDPSRPHVRPPLPAACSPKPTEDGRATWAAVGCCGPLRAALLARPATAPGPPSLCCRPRRHTRSDIARLASSMPASRALARGESVRCR